MALVEVDPLKQGVERRNFDFSNGFSGSVWARAGVMWFELTMHLHSFHDDLAFCITRSRGFESEPHEELADETDIAETRRKTR